jgi:hypothetical protein
MFERACSYRVWPKLRRFCEQTIIQPDTTPFISSRLRLYVHFDAVPGRYGPQYKRNARNDNVSTCLL